MDYASVGIGAITAAVPLLITMVRSRVSVKKQITDTATKMNEDIQTRLSNFADKEHARRVEAEIKMLNEARACDQRIEEQRKANDTRVDALRERNDKLYDLQIKLLEEKADLRAEIHSLRSEVALWRKQQKKGGLRQTDPPAE